MSKFETLNFSDLLAQRIIQKKQQEMQQSSEFDPYNLLVKRNGPIEDLNYIQYDPEDIKELENFCKERGILGINFGTCDPKATLKMLKSKIGYVSNEEKSTNKSLLLD